MTLSSGSNQGISHCAVILFVKLKNSRAKQSPGIIRFNFRCGLKIFRFWHRFDMDGALILPFEMKKRVDLMKYKRCPESVRNRRSGAGILYPNCRSSLRNVCRRLVSRFLTAIASALRVPTRTARFLALVKPVYIRFRNSILKCWVRTGIITTPNSLPCDL